MVKESIGKKMERGKLEREGEKADSRIQETPNILTEIMRKTVRESQRAIRQRIEVKRDGIHLKKRKQETKGRENEEYGKSAQKKSQRDREDRVKALRVAGSQRYV